MYTVPGKELRPKIQVARGEELSDQGTLVHLSACLRICTTITHLKWGKQNSEDLRPCQPHPEVEVCVLANCFHSLTARVIYNLNSFLSPSLSQEFDRK